MSLICESEPLSGIQIAIIIGLAVVCLIVLIAIIATVITMNGKSNAPAERTVYVNSPSGVPQQPQVILLQAPSMPVATITPEIIEEPVYVDASDDDEDTDEVVWATELEEPVYDAVALIEDPEKEEIPVGKIIAADGMKVVDDDAIVFKSVTRKTFDEAYADLTKEQKSFFDGILEYALTKPDAKEYRTKSNIKVKSKGGQIVKLLIRRETTVTSFLIENDMLKTYRKELAKNDGAKITVKATDLPLTDVDTFEAAKGLVDVAYEQIEHERELAKEARKERRRQAREAAKKS